MIYSPPVPKWIEGRKVRYAVVGAGWIAQEDFMPGVEHTGNSSLVALVTRDPAKAKDVASKYKLSAVYDYEHYDKMLESGEADAIYLAVPNALHREYAVRALQSGVHVLCEKPMAPTETDCRAMIDAAETGRAKLMIAYRLHFEEATIEAIEILRSGLLGDPRFFTSVFTQQISEENSRTHDELWANPLPDMGPYPINAVRQLFQAEPVEAFAFAARKNEPRFAEIDEMFTVTLRFPQERLASFTVSYGANPVDLYRVDCTEGNLEVCPGYMFTEPLCHKLTVGQKTVEQRFAQTDQFGSETKYFSDCILNNLQPEPDGEEGLADIRVIAAIEQSLRTGKPQTVKQSPPRFRRPNRKQVISLPPIQGGNLLHAAGPSGG
jgi:predicted dehydrogenase